VDVLLYFDFTKAFDPISHDTLAVKLRKCGIDEWTVRWTESWLSSKGGYHWHRVWLEAYN